MSPACAAPAQRKSLTWCSPCIACCPSTRTLLHSALHLSVPLCICIQADACFHAYGMPASTPMECLLPRLWNACFHAYGMPASTPFCSSECSVTASTPQKRGGRRLSKEARAGIASFRSCMGYESLMLEGFDIRLPFNAPRLPRALNPLVGCICTALLPTCLNRVGCIPPWQ